MGFPEPADALADECRSAAPFLKNEVESPLKRDNQVSPSLSPQSLATAGGESPVTSAPPVTPTHTSENASLGSDIGDDSDFADLQDCVIQEKIVVPAPIDNTLAENAHTEDVSDVSASDDLSASGAEEVVIVQVNRSINVAPKVVVVTLAVQRLLTSSLFPPRDRSSSSSTGRSGGHCLPPRRVALRRNSGACRSRQMSLLA